MRRIGIMGGTFNPIHNGHLAIAGKAKEQFALEKVLFMPSGVPYMKDQREVLPIQVRCEMTALAISGIPGFALSKLEAADAAQGKNTYTCDTLQKLKHADPDADYYFILGADSLYAIEEWKKPALIFQNCTILVAVRENEATQESLSFLGNKLSTGNLNTVRSQNRLIAQVQYLREKYHASVEILSFTGMDISSTQIREGIRKGESLRGLLPEAVETYIRRKRLYENSERKDTFNES